MTKNTITHFVGFMLSVLATQAQAALLVSDNNAEYLSIHQYQNTSGQATEVTQVVTFNRTLLSTASAIYQHSITRDAFSGKTLKTISGKQEAMTLFTRDALGRVRQTIETETDSDNKPHTMITDTTHLLSANGEQVITTRMANDGKTPYYQQYKHYNSLGQASSETDSVHGKLPLMTWHYTDLGQVADTVDRQGQTKRYFYDAEHRLTQTLTKQADTQRVLHHHKHYDDVANTVTDWTEGDLEQTHDSTGKHIRYLDDENQVIQEVEQGTGQSVQVNSQQVMDNFGDQVSEVSNNLTQIQAKGAMVEDAPLTTQFTYHADGSIASARLRKRASHPTDTQINSVFYQDLHGNIIAKTVQGVQHYRYTYDANNALLAETRCTSKDCQTTLQTTYDYQQGDGYHVTIHDFQQREKQLTYQQVDGEKKRARQVSPDYIVTRRYNYLVGKIASITKTDHQGKLLSRIRYQYRPDGLLLSQTSDVGQAIQYHYCTDKTNLDKLCSKVDAAGVVSTYHYDGKAIDEVKFSIGNQLIASVHHRYGVLNELQQTDRYDYVNGDAQQGDKVDSIHYAYHDPFKRITDIDFLNTGFKGDRTVNHIHYDYNFTDSTGRVFNTDHIMRKIQYADSADKQTITDYRYGNGKQILRSRRQVKTNQQTDIMTKTYGYDQKNPVSIGINFLSIGKFGWQMKPAQSWQCEYNTLDQLRSITQILVGKRSTIDIPYENGNMQRDEKNHRYGYNQENQETRYVDARGTETDYRYNAKQQRDGKMQGDTTLRYIYDADELSNVFETKGTDAGDKVSFLDDGQVQGRVVLSADNHVKALQFFQQDKRHSTVNQLTVDGTGKLTSAVYYYGDDGAVVDTTADTSTKLSIFYNAMQFAGYHDQETGVQGTDYKRARSVHNFGWVTRFMTMDYGQKLINLYELDEGDSNDYWDENGHMAEPKELLGIVEDIVRAVEPEVEPEVELGVVVVDDAFRARLAAARMPRDFISPMENPAIMEGKTEEVMPRVVRESPEPTPRVITTQPRPWDSYPRHVNVEPEVRSAPAMPAPILRHREDLLSPLGENPWRVSREMR